MKTIFPLLLSSFVTSIALGQASPSKRIDQTEALARSSRSDELMTPYILDSILGLHQRALSGYMVTDGKMIGSTATITEKGATVNIGLKEFVLGEGTVYLAGSATASGDDKFAQVFKDGKYQHTISVGGTINWFPAIGVASFNCETKKLVQDGVNDIVNSRKCYDCEKDIWKVKEKEDFICKMLEDAKIYMELMTSMDCNGRRHLPNVVEAVENGKKAIDTLLSMKLLPPKYEGMPLNKQVRLIADSFSRCKKNWESLLDQELLSRAEKFQISAPWNSLSLHWFTFKGNYNSTPQPIIDTSNLKDKYKRTYNNEFFTGSFSYNYTRLYKNKSQFQITWSPTFMISTARQFKDENKITIVKLSPYKGVGGDTIWQKDFETEGHTEVAGRKAAWSVEVPYLMFWNKANIGIEIAIRGGVNDPLNDNFGGRIGMYIPVQVKDDIPVWIQPVIKVGKLFEKGNLGFWKDNISFGFNLSVALKKVTVIK